MANLSTGKFLVMYGVKVEINTTPEATQGTYAEIGDGITNVSEALNEVKQQMYYLINKGFGQTEVTAMHPAITFTGNRLKGFDETVNVGIGTNYAARLIGVILEDEKAYHTVHIAFGTNIGFGGVNKAACHMDGIIKNPTLYLDDTLVLKDGEFQI